MLIRLLLPLVIVLIIAVGTTVHAQEAIRFDELAELIDPFFAPELIEDVRREMPEDDFMVWGYDVGDYSGDGYNDLVMTTRMLRDRGRNISVYFFVDVEGILTLVKKEATNFVELPIEVGVTVTQGNAYRINKREEYGWTSYGYHFRDGVLIQVDEFITEQRGAMVHERYRNFQTLEAYDRYVRLRDDKEEFRSDFLVVPSYTRSRDLSTGYNATAMAKLTRYVKNGAYYWKGEDDFSVEVRSAHDEEYLYFNIMVRDDQVVPLGSEDADSIGDHVEIWLDVHAFGDRIYTGKKNNQFRVKTDTNIYGFTISLGDFIAQHPRVKVSTSNLLDEMQSASMTRIKAVTVMQDDGYSLKVRIPFHTIGFEGPPMDDSALTELGLTVRVHDYDSKYRPEEVTIIDTSGDFDPSKPATFGSLLLVPPALHYGDTANIYLSDIKKRLEEVGL